MSVAANLLEVAGDPRIQAASIRRQRRRAWHANRRAATLGNAGRLDGADVEDIFDRQEGRCFYCDAPLDYGWDLDHKIPLSRGGANTPENVCVACAFCNGSKGARTPSEWEHAKQAKATEASA